MPPPPSWGFSSWLWPLGRACALLVGQGQLAPWWAVALAHRSRPGCLQRLPQGPVLLSPSPWPSTRNLSSCQSFVPGSPRRAGVGTRAKKPESHLRCDTWEPTAGSMAQPGRPCMALRSGHKRSGVGTRVPLSWAPERSRGAVRQVPTSDWLTSSRVIPEQGRGTQPVIWAWQIWQMPTRTQESASGGNQSASRSALFRRNVSLAKLLSLSDV